MYFQKRSVQSARKKSALTRITGLDSASAVPLVVDSSSECETRRPRTDSETLPTEDSVTSSIHTGTKRTYPGTPTKTAEPYHTTVTTMTGVQSSNATIMVRSSTSTQSSTITRPDSSHTTVIDSPEGVVPNTDVTTCTSPNTSMFDPPDSKQDDRGALPPTTGGCGAKSDIRRESDTSLVDGKESGPPQIEETAQSILEGMYQGGTHTPWLDREVSDTGSELDTDHFIL